MLLFFVFLAINSQIFFESATIYFDSVSFFCRSATIYQVEKVFKINLEDEILDVKIRSLSAEAQNISGEISGIGIQSEFFRLENGVYFQNLCISLCSLRCPNSILAGEIFFDPSDEKIRVSSPKFNLPFLSLPLSLFLPRKFTLEGKSPGFSNPTFSLSQKHGVILGTEFFVPFSYFFSESVLRPLDLSLYPFFFSKTKIFLFGGNFSYSGRSVFFEGENNFAGKDIFSSRLNFFVPGAFGLNYKIFTFRFLSSIPASVETASLPFSSAYQNFSDDLKISQSSSLSFYNQIFFYSNHISESVSSFGFGFFGGDLNLKNLSFGVGGVFGNSDVFGFSPFLRSSVYFSRFSLAGRFLFPYSEKGFFKDFFVLPFVPFSTFRLSDFLYQNLFLSPGFLSLSFSYDFVYDFAFFHPFFSLNSLFYYSGIDIVPELGGEFISYPFSFFSSFSFWRNNFVSDVGLGLDFDFFSPSFRIFSFGRKIMIENTLNFPLSFGNIDLNLSGAFILTNSAYKFAFSFFQPEQHNFEGFSSVSFNWGFSDFSFNSSFLFYLAEFKAFRFVQLSSFLNYYLKKLCGDFYSGVIYNFTSYGEPRISFGVRLRL
jgi:hypothetical protein